MHGGLVLMLNALFVSALIIFWLQDLAQGGVKLRP